MASRRGSVLGELQELSAELGKVCALGACEPGNLEGEQPELAPGEELLRLLRLKEQVKNQQLELQNAIDSNEEVPPDFLTEEKLPEIRQELLNEIGKLKVAFQNKTLVLQRIQLSHTLLSKMQENSSESKLIQETCKHILGLSSSIHKSQQETKELDEKINEVRKKRLNLKDLSSKMMAQTQAMKKNWKCDLEEIQNEKIKRIREVLKKESEMTMVVQNVFQILVFCSHVNWAAHPKLKEIVLKQEKDLNSL